MNELVRDSYYTVNWNNVEWTNLSEIHTTQSTGTTSNERTCPRFILHSQLEQRRMNELARDSYYTVNWNNVEWTNLSEIHTTQSTGATSNERTCPRFILHSQLEQRRMIYLTRDSYYTVNWSNVEWTNLPEIRTTQSTGATSNERTCPRFILHSQLEQRRMNELVRDSYYTVNWNNVEWTNLSEIHTTQSTGTTSNERTCPRFILHSQLEQRRMNDLARDSYYTVNWSNVEWTNLSEIHTTQSTGATSNERTCPRFILHSQLEQRRMNELTRDSYYTVNWSNVEWTNLPEIHTTQSTGATSNERTCPRFILHSQLEQRRMNELVRDSYYTVNWSNVEWTNLPEIHTTQSTGATSNERTCPRFVLHSQLEQRRMNELARDSYYTVNWSNVEWTNLPEIHTTQSTGATSNERTCPRFVLHSQLEQRRMNELARDSYYTVNWSNVEWTNLPEIRTTQSTGATSNERTCPRFVLHSQLEQRRMNELARDSYYTVNWSNVEWTNLPEIHTTQSTGTTSNERTCPRFILHSQLEQRRMNELARDSYYTVNWNNVEWTNLPEIHTTQSTGATSNERTCPRFILHSQLEQRRMNELARDSYYTVNWSNVEWTNLPEIHTTQSTGATSNERTCPRFILHSQLEQRRMNELARDSYYTVNWSNVEWTNLPEIHTTQSTGATSNERTCPRFILHSQLEQRRMNELARDSYYTVNWSNVEWTNLPEIHTTQSTGATSNERTARDSYYTVNWSNVEWTNLPEIHTTQSTGATSNERTCPRFILHSQLEQRRMNELARDSYYTVNWSNVEWTNLPEIRTTQSTGTTSNERTCPRFILHSQLEQRRMNELARDSYYTVNWSNVEWTNLPEIHTTQSTGATSNERTCPRFTTQSTGTTSNERTCPNIYIVFCN